MYFLFRDKKWKPTDYMDMGPGEKRVVHAFMIKEMESREEMLKKMESEG